MGFSKNDFFRKMSNPRASKPWRDRKIEVSGRIDVTPTSDVINEDGDTLLGNLGSSTVPPLGIQSPFVGPGASSLEGLQGQYIEQQLRDGHGGRRALSSPGSDLPRLRAEHEREGDNTGNGMLRPLEGGNFSSVGPYGSPSLAHLSERAGEGDMHVLPGNHRDANALGPPMAALPFGNSLTVNVDEVKTYEDGPVPLHLQHLRRSKKEVADSIMLPKHINKLFHKIMGWSEELVEMEAAGEEGRGGEVEDTPAVLRKKKSNLTEKVKYGLLLDSYEKDKFALEHQLTVAGNAMERKFLEWEGVHVLDQNPSADMEHVLENKASIVIDAPATFHIPIVNRDCCPGCGALLQDKDEHEFGYVGKGEVEKYVAERQEKAQLRAEYARRMVELQTHWEKHGRQVGEEWLDFMTQDEFNAYYRDRRLPFVCHRCHALENLNVTGRRKIWSAPDFTEELKALREKKCVVVLVIDITDFPGSMVYDLTGLISMNNDVIIAANKMDCIRNRSFKYKGQDRAVAASLVSKRYVAQWVKDIAVQMGLPRHRIKAVVPVSAKRGWNMDVLISEIENAANLNLRRPHKPLPTYFAGVANVGKSSVINAIAHHLYVPQPPHPESKKVYYTKIDPKTGKELVLWRWYTPPNVNRAEMFDIPAHHDKKASKLLTVSSLPGTTVAMNAVKISLTNAKSNDHTGGEQEQTYFYDTPGLLPHWHRESPLTLYQMRRTLIRAFRNPQCFILVPGHTLLLGGLAAIDVMRGPTRGLLFMVYTSHKVRNAIVSTEKSDSFWAEQLGKAIDPPGSYEQLLDASLDGTPPSLSVSKSYLFECYNKHRRRPKADIYVCGLGWVAFCVSEPADVVLRVRTLPGVVHGVRLPLRYNDLRPFKFWPKIKRSFTSKGLEDAAAGQDSDSINTVVRLTAAANAAATSQGEGNEGEGEEVQVGGIVGRRVEKVRHPRHEAASDAPLEALMDDLHASGKL